MTKIGDIYLTKLERDFWGSFKILKSGKLNKSDDNEVLLVAVLDIIDKSKPTIADNRLNNVLYCQRFFFDEYCVQFFDTNWADNEFKKYELLGNLPVTPFEQKLKFKLGDGRGLKPDGFPSTSRSLKDFLDSSFLEWRWKNEEEDFKAEIEKRNQIAKELYANRVLEPKKMMGENQFWKIVALFNWNEEYDDKIVEPAIKHLAKLKVSDIKQFQENLTYKLYCLDTKEHAKNIGDASYNETDDYVSVDFFLYARCKAVANGQIFYDTVLKDPTQMPKDEDFEVLLGVSGTAYELKTKKELDYSTGCDYETYSNKEGWK